MSKLGHFLVFLLNTLNHYLPTEEILEVKGKSSSQEDLFFKVAKNVLMQIILTDANMIVTLHGKIILDGNLNI